jgi:hypothetical protein
MMNAKEYAWIVLAIGLPVFATITVKWFLAGTYQSGKWTIVMFSTWGLILVALLAGFPMMTLHILQ